VKNKLAPAAVSSLPPALI